MKNRPPAISKFRHRMYARRDELNYTNTEISRNSGLSCWTIVRYLGFNAYTKRSGTLGKICGAIHAMPIAYLGTYHPPPETFPTLEPKDVGPALIQQFRKSVRYLLKEEGLRLRDLGDRMGLFGTQIYNWWQKKATSMSLDQMDRVANALERDLTLELVPFDSPAPPVYDRPPEHEPTLLEVGESYETPVWDRGYQEHKGYFAAKFHGIIISRKLNKKTRILTHTRID